MLHTLSRIYTDLCIQYATHVICACKRSKLPFIQLCFSKKKKKKKRKDESLNSVYSDSVILCTVGALNLRHENNNYFSRWTLARKIAKGDT